MITPVFHIVIEEGCDYTRTFTYEDPETGLPIDLTGWGAFLQVRQKYNGYVNPDIDLQFYPTLGGADGTVQVVIPGSSTTNLYWTVAVYDILLVSPENTRTKLVHGFFEVMPSVTKDVGLG